MPGLAHSMAATGRPLGRQPGYLLAVMCLLWWWCSLGMYVLDGTQIVQQRDARVVPLAAAVASDGVAAASSSEPPLGSILDQPGTTHISFQPDTAPIPDGWLADKGRALDVRTNGFTYGWSASGQPQALAPPHSVERERVSQTELDTLHILTGSDATAAWSMTLENGTYAVVVMAGDPTSRQHTNHLLLNGQTLTDPDPYDANESSVTQEGDYDGWAVEVTVTDGRLSLSAATGAFDPALCLIEIGPKGSHVDDALRRRVADAVTAANARVSVPAIARAPTPRTFAYGGDYIDAPLAMKAGSGAAAKTYFIHANALYSPVAVTDGDRKVVEGYSYSAFGARTVFGSDSDAVSALGMNFGFTGLQDDGGMLFARSRYFSPELGRWISRDVAWYVDGYGLYGAYFAPNGADPSGLAGYFFDGTGNSRYTPNNQANLPTNVARLWNGYTDGTAFYVPGVGSGYNANGIKDFGPSLYQRLTGEAAWGDSMDDRANYMVYLLENQLKAGDKIVDLFGFSRGAATATLFLNKIKRRMECNAELYSDIRFRYVALFDQVPSDMGLIHQTVGRTLDATGYLISLGFLSPNVYTRNADNPSHQLPKGMSFEVQPLHLIAMDEHRKEFAVSDIVGARQIGFAGVYSDIGGSYGGFLEYITLNYVLDDQAKRWLQNHLEKPGECCIKAHAHFGFVEALARH